ncbi:MAG: hypothetical protein D4R81_04265 [Nitrospiraceae bacterium]|nr:MAG: hypothetical protein D4R81_04265 [Nitrospiraceae bacterium]
MTISFSDLVTAFLISELIACFMPMVEIPGHAISQRFLDALMRDRASLWRIATAEFHATWRDDSLRKQAATSCEGNPFKKRDVACLVSALHILDPGRISHKEDGV